MGHALSPSFHTRPNISKIVQIPTPKTKYILVPYDETHDTNRGSPGCMPHPHHLIKGHSSETIQIPTPKPYIVVPYEKTYSVTLTRVPGLHAPSPSLHKMPNICETIQIPTPKPYIILFPMITCIQWHWFGCPLGVGPPPPILMAYYLRTCSEPNP